MEAEPRPNRNPPRLVAVAIGEEHIWERRPAAYVFLIDCASWILCRKGASNLYAPISRVLSLTNQPRFMQIEHCYAISFFGSCERICYDSYPVSLNHSFEKAASLNQSHLQMSTAPKQKSPFDESTNQSHNYSSCVYILRCVAAIAFVRCYKSAS